MGVEDRCYGFEAQSFKIAMWSLAALCFLLLVGPTLVVIIVSFTSGFSLKFPPPGYSFRWYVALLYAWQLHFAASNSLKIAVGATLLSVVLGVAAALAIARSEKWTARVRDSLFMSPLVLPALAFGLAALMFFTLVGMSVSPLTLVIGHTVVCVPYVVRTTVAALAQLNVSLLESSASVGASRLFTLRRVTLPLIRESWPVPSSPLWRRSTMCPCRCSCAMRAQTCCRSACGRIWRAGST
jgi:putative spermidine/putrescine transport system permease protein